MSVISVVGGADFQILFNMIKIKFLLYNQNDIKKPNHLTVLKTVIT